MLPAHHCRRIRAPPLRPLRAPPTLAPPQRSPTLAPRAPQPVKAAEPEKTTAKSPRQPKHAPPPQQRPLKLPPQAYIARDHGFSAWKRMVGAHGNYAHRGSLASTAKAAVEHAATAYRLAELPVSMAVRTPEPSGAQTDRTVEQRKAAVREAAYFASWAPAAGGKPSFYPSTLTPRQKKKAPEPVAAGPSMQVKMIRTLHGLD